MKPSDKIKKRAYSSNIFLKDDWKDNHTREFQWIKHILNWLDEEFEKNQKTVDDGIFEK